MRKTSICFALFILLLLSGCVTNGGKVHIQNDTKADIEKAKNIFEDEKRLTGAVAIFHEKEIISGVIVKPFSKFNKVKIEKELTKKLEKHYKEFDVTVSADSKIIYETNKLMKSTEKEKLEKKIKELKALSEEET